MGHIFNINQIYGIGMNSFYLKLIYDYVMNGDKEAANKVVRGTGLAPVVVDGIYYPDISFKAKMDLAKQNGEDVTKALLSRNLTSPSGNSKVTTCYELFLHILENKPIKLPVPGFKENHVNVISAINEEDLNTIITTLIINNNPDVVQVVYATLREKLLESFLQNIGYYQCKAPGASEPILWRNSREFQLLNTCVNSIEYGYALQTNLEALATFQSQHIRDVHISIYSLSDEKIINALACHGDINKINKYINTHYLKRQDFHNAIIAGFAAVGHHQLLETYCLANNINASTLKKGLDVMLIPPLSSARHLTDEDALRLLIEAKDANYKKMLQDALSKIFLLDTHLKIREVIPPLAANDPLKDVELDFEPNKFFPLQKNTLWVYADAIRQIMNQTIANIREQDGRECSEEDAYNHAIQNYFFIDPNSTEDNQAFDLPDFVENCHQWVKALGCLYTSNDFLKEEPHFDKMTILFELAFQKIDTYVESIHLKPCDFSNANATQMLNDLSNFKQKTLAYLQASHQKEKIPLYVEKALGESAFRAAEHFQKTEDIDGWKILKGIGLIALGLVLIPSGIGIIGTAYAWRCAYSFFKEAGGETCNTHNHLKEIHEIVERIQRESPLRISDPERAKFF